MDQRKASGAWERESLNFDVHCFNGQFLLPHNASLNWYQQFFNDMFIYLRLMATFNAAASTSANVHIFMDKFRFDLFG